MDFKAPMVRNAKQKSLNHSLLLHLPRGPEVTKGTLQSLG